MASNARALKSQLLLVPASKTIPATFLEALRQGWNVENETTTLAVDKRHRDGTLTLIKSGFSNLCVPYIASVKQGYTFEKPRVA